MPIRYLIANGHRRIAYASGDPLTSAYHYKLLGYQMALEEAGIPYREDYVFESKYLATEGYCVARKIIGTPRRNTPYGGNVCLGHYCGRRLSIFLREPDPNP